MEDSNDKIVIDIPKSLDEIFGYEVFSELEVYLGQGFLVTHANVYGMHFIFKSLNDVELKLLELMRTPQGLGLKSRVTHEDYFIGYSIFMLNGENMLVDRPSCLSKIANIVAKIPQSQKLKIIKKLSELNDKVIRLYPLVEVYCHEPRTRIKWSTHKRQLLNTPALTGIPGTEKLGLNTAQRTYMALSEILDRREQAENEWNNAKFIAGAFVGREINKVHDKDRSRIAKEKSDVQELKFKVLNAYLNRDDPYVGDEEEGGVVSLPDGRQATVVSRKQATTAQELAQELSAALSHEKDEHDLIVDQYLAKSAEEAHQLEQERLRSLYASQKVLQSNTLEGSLPLSQTGDDNLIQRLNKIRINDPQNSGNE
jgi:hypothetical protein